MDFKVRYNIVRNPADILQDDPKRVPMVSFFVDHSHPDVDANELFRKAFTFGHASEAVGYLLDRRFPSNHGNHNVAQRIFMIDLEPNEDVDFEITANLSESYGGFEIDPETVQFDLYRDGELVSRLGNLKTTEFERITGQALKI